MHDRSVPADTSTGSYPGTTATTPPVEVVEVVSEPTVANKNKLSRNLAFQALNVLSTFLMLTVSSIVTARYFGATIMGQYGILTTISSAVINSGALGLTDTASRFVAEYFSRGERQKLLGFIQFGILAVVVVSTLTAAGFYFFAQSLATFFHLDGNANYFILTGLVVAPAMLGNMMTSILAGLQRYDLIAVIKVVTNLPLLALIVVVLQLQLGITGVLVVNILVNVVAFSLWFILVLRLVPFYKETRAFSLTDFKKVAVYSLGMLLVALLNLVVWQRSEVFFLGIYRDNRETGLYVTAFVISSVFTTLINNTLHIMIPALADRVGKGDLLGIASLFRTSARLTALLAVPVSCGGILLANELLWLLYGPQFVEAGSVLRILFIATLASTLSSCCGFTIISTSRSNTPYLITMIALAIVNISLDFMVIPGFGVVGAAICNTLVQAIAPFLYDRLLRRSHGFGFPFTKVRTIIMIGIIGLAVSFLCEYVFSGLPGLILAVLLFSAGYCAGIIFSKAIYQEDLQLLLNFLARVRFPAWLLLQLNKLASRLEVALEVEPAVLK